MMFSILKVIDYNPGEDCLTYDGSVVPDCTLYVDPEIKEPYYKEHSTSKFKVVKNIIILFTPLRLQ